MSTLKFELNKNDFLMDKVTKDLYWVITIDLHNVVLRLEKEGNDVPLKKMPKHMINLSMMKVKPDVFKVLYGNKDGSVDKDNIPDIAEKQDTNE